jgi:hypothetical protein
LRSLQAVSEPLRPYVALRCALALAGVCLFFTNLDSYAFAANSAPPPVLLVQVFAGAAAILVLGSPRHSIPLLRSPLLVWTWFYFLVTTVWALWMRDAPEVIQDLHDRYRSIVFLLTFAVLFDEPRARRVAMLAVAAGVTAASLLNVAETLSLVTFPDLPGHSRAAGRAAGFYINANGSGLAIAFGLPVAITALPKALRAPLLLLSAVGVIATFSRGAAICFLLVFVWLVWRRTFGGTWAVVLLTSCVVLLLAYVIAYGQTHNLLNDDTSARLMLTKDDTGRLALTLKAWNIFLSSPLIGEGLGSTRVWNEPLYAHNMFATLAADHGVIGLIMFPALGFALIAASGGAAGGFALALMAAGFFSHDLLTERFVLLLAALAASNGASVPSATLHALPDGHAVGSS